MSGGKLQINVMADVQLYVTGHKGDFDEVWSSGNALPLNSTTHLATLTWYIHEWGWVYLGTAPGRLDYQVYLELRHVGKDTGGYAFFGWYDPDSTQSNSNPKPFPSGVAQTFLLLDPFGATYGYYELLTRPPA